MNTANTFIRAGRLVHEMLGVEPVDLARPNDGGGATPIAQDDPRALPLYRRTYRCPRVAMASGARRRGCGNVYAGLSFRPQYDDDVIEERLCDHCQAAYEREQRTGEPARPELHLDRPARTGE